MGDAQGQGRVAEFVFFLDENHCGNPHLHRAFAERGVRFEKHTDHFLRGLPDTEWLPVVARNGWVVLTADARIRHNALERKAIKDHRLRLFYFARNDFAGAEMGSILGKALPRMLELCRSQRPPFAASIARSGDVSLRDTRATL